MDHPIEEKLKECNGSCDHSTFNEIRKILEKVVAFQPPVDRAILNTPDGYYNDHGIYHFERVEDNYFEIIEKSGISLTCCEYLLVLLSIWFHDIALFFKPSGETQDEGRNHHHIRVGSVIDILENGNHISKMDLVQKQLLIDICQGHSRKINLDGINPHVVWNGQEIRPRLLSSILRVADALDIDKRRAPESIFEIFEDGIPEHSKIHWKKHFGVSGTRINPNHSSVDIDVFFTKNNLDSYVQQHILADWVRKEVLDELNSVEKIFEENKIPLHNVRLMDGTSGNRIELDSHPPTHMVINVTQQNLTEENLEKLEKIIQENSGDVGIVLKVILEDQTDINITLPPNFNIGSSESIQGQLKTVFGSLQIDTIRIPTKRGAIRN